MQSSRQEYMHTHDLLLLPCLSTSWTVMAPSVFMAEGPVLAPASRASQSFDSSSSSGRMAAWNAKMYQDLSQFANTHAWLLLKSITLKRPLMYLGWLPNMHIRAEAASTPALQCTAELQCSKTALLFVMHKDHKAPPDKSLHGLQQNMLAVYMYFSELCMTPVAVSNNA